jgi:hypothetical protein
MNYVGQTTRTVKIRWKEHRVSASYRLLNTAISEYGQDNFHMTYVREYPNDQLDQIEIDLIAQYNCLHPNGYNIRKGGANIDANRKGGQSDIGHNKHSAKLKERYNDIPKLACLGDIPRGISYYYKKPKRGNPIEGFKVRKVGIKSKEFLSSIKKNNLSYNLNRAKQYLIENE